MVRLMLMVIFGAGASYDSYETQRPPTDGTVEEDRPPLGRELFQERESFLKFIQHFPQCQPVIGQLRRAGETGDVEQELERIREARNIDPGHYAELNAVRFYLRSAIDAVQQQWQHRHRGATNYAALMGKLRQWNRETGTPVRLVTFNYDTLLENACEAARTGFKRDRVSFDPYIERDDFRIYKPHGSIDWVQLLASEPEYDGRSDQDLIIEEGENLDLLDNGFRIVQGTNKFRVHEDSSVSESERLALPALALPLTEKAEFVSPPGHIEALRSDLGVVTDVLVIGWRASEQHFVNMWSEARAATEGSMKPTVTVVSGGGFAVVQSNLEPNAIEVRAAEASTFSDFVVRGSADYLADLA
jgi:hypothetical protein